MLAESSGAVVTTIARDASVFGGALSAWRGPRAPALAAADPFARVHAAHVLHVGPGLFATPAALPAPVIERYGGQPWPVDRFP